MRMKEGRGNAMKNGIRSWIRSRVAAVVADDEKRYWLQMVWVLRIVAIIVLVMSAVNLLTREFFAILPTAVFGVVCLVVTFAIERHPAWKRLLIIVELLALTALFAWFIVSGEPEGFSPIWICIVPPVALLLLGRWVGGVACLTLFIMMVFFMWTPWGRSLLAYDYHESFLTRLPLVYTAAFWVSWFLEYVRETTQKQLLATQQTLRHLYRHDALTGIMNRHGFNEHIGEVARKEHTEGLALMFIDLDDFKQTNDVYGHPTGDTVLKELAETIRRVIGSAGEVSRWGGEEFAVLLHRSQGARDMAEALRAAAAAICIPCGEAVVRVTVSIGLTVCDMRTIDVERLVTLTDVSLYQAKKGGKNRVVSCEYTPADA